jgi:hypothetical protein
MGFAEFKFNLKKVFEEDSFFWQPLTEMLVNAETGSNSGLWSFGA